jgi:GNAT superfamily N-acetyltransferase
MKIQKQRWDGYDKYVIWAEKGSVQIDVFDKPQGERKMEAYLYALWVEEDARKQGLGKQLREAAEDIARKRGCNTVHLEWSNREAPYWVLDWYCRNGYDEKEFGEHCALMMKLLTKGGEQ